LILINAYANAVSKSQFDTKRRDSAACGQKEAEIDNTMDACDNAVLLFNAVFVAMKLDSLPKCNPEDLNVY
jgi:hypothetical protein